MHCTPKLVKSKCNRISNQNSVCNTMMEEYNQKCNFIHVGHFNSSELSVSYNEIYTSYASRKNTKKGNNKKEQIFPTYQNTLMDAAPNPHTELTYTDVQYRHTHTQ